MKKIFIFAVAGLAFSLVESGRAEEKSLDPIVVGKGIYSLKAEDSDTRAMEVNFKPGEKIDLHQHPKHVAYAVTAGKLKISAEGKEPSEVELKAGDAMIIPAEKHSAQNIGKKPLKLVVVELKGK